MAIVIASSDSEDSTASAMAPPLPSSVRAWGKQYIMDAMRERGFPKHVAYSTAVGHFAEWLGLQGAPLLRAVWSSMEPEEGPEFCASFEVIFGQPFWPLVMHLEEGQGATKEDSTLVEDHDDASEDCNADLDSPGERLQARGLTNCLTSKPCFGQDNDSPTQPPQPPAPLDAQQPQEKHVMQVTHSSQEDAEESPLTTDAVVEM